MRPECRTVNALGQPDAGDPHVRLDEGALESGGDGPLGRDTHPKGEKRPGPTRPARCLRQRPTLQLRNILAKLPKVAATQLKSLVQQVFLAPDHATGLRRGRALIARFRSRYPSAMECLEKDLDECLTYLLFPKEHQRRLRTTNLLERTFEESRRRTKVIPRFPGERSCLTLMYATLITASRTWRGIPMTAKILRELDKLRALTPAIVKEQAVA